MLDYLLDRERYVTLDHDSVAVVCDLIAETGYVPSEFELLRIERFECQTAHWISLWHHIRSGVDFALIPAGKFIMGSPESEPGHSSDETQREVAIESPMLVSITPAHDKDREAITNVTWHEAMRYARALNLDLLFEEEWEYMARAGTQTAYCFGNDSSQLNDYGHSGLASAPKVGLKKPNAFGIRDIHGGWWEWTRSAFSKENQGLLDEEAAKIPFARQTAYTSRVSEEMRTSPTTSSGVGVQSEHAVLATESPSGSANALEGENGSDPSATSSHETTHGGSVEPATTSNGQEPVHVHPQPLAIIASMTTKESDSSSDSGGCETNPFPVSHVSDSPSTESGTEFMQNAGLASPTCAPTSSASDRASSDFDSYIGSVSASVHEMAEAAFGPVVLSGNDIISEPILDLNAYRFIPPMTIVQQNEEAQRMLGVGTTHARDFLRRWLRDMDMTMGSAPIGAYSFTPEDLCLRGGRWHNNRSRLEAVLRVPEITSRAPMYREARTISRFRLVYRLES
jgi:hypothetical protein